jgi:5'-nucleotidase
MKVGKAGAHRVVVLLTAAALSALVGCGDDDSDGSADDQSTTTQRSDTTAVAEPLDILVTNDDGYAAEGIDALVEGLGTLDDVSITVVTPLEQQSGTGGKSTEGELDVSEVTLASGHKATAVDGFPADSVRVALDELDVEADLVVSGINEGQNVGPAVDLSGTVGAARAAVARGVPALAVSSGTTTFDYEAAVPLVLDWVTDNRDAILGATFDIGVTNLNVPSCEAGEVRGVAEVEADLDGDVNSALGPQDCTSTDPLDPDAGDVEAFLDGYATIGPVPDEPATPPEVVPG